MDILIISQFSVKKWGYICIVKAKHWGSMRKRQLASCYGFAKHLKSILNQSFNSKQKKDWLLRGDDQQVQIQYFWPADGNEARLLKMTIFGRVMGSRTER